MAGGLMEHRKLGELDAPAVGLGCNNFGRRLDLDGTRAVVDAALEAAVTFLDTADVYGSEAGAGEARRGGGLGARRDAVVLATKFGMDMAARGGSPPDAPRGSREYIRWGIDGSLRPPRADLSRLVP